jgi:hypothetical protein
MGTVTYPNTDVAQFIDAHFVPVQFNVETDPGAMERFTSHWTPTIIVQDAGGTEHRRSQGYLDPKRMLGEMALGLLKDAVDRGDFEAAKQRVADAERFTAGDAEREPETKYWASVVAYKSTNDPNNLMKGWNDLLDRYPDSEWAKRAEFIRQ